MKLKKNAGFTLTELVVVMAVSSIFLGMVMLILANTMNLFNKHEDTSDVFSDTVMIDNMVTVYFEEINKEGYKVILDEEANEIYNNGENVNKIHFDNENKKVVMDLASREEDNVKEFNGITIDIEMINDKSISIKYFEDEVLIKETIIHVLGGVSNV